MGATVRRCPVQRTGAMPTSRLNFVLTEFSGVRLTIILGSSLSSGAAQGCLRIRQEAPEDGIGDAPFEAAQRLLAGFALHDLLTVVGAAPSIRPGLTGGDHVQGVVELAVAGQREPMAHHLPARGLKRRRSGVRGEMGFGREALHVAYSPDDPGGQDGSYAEDLG